MRTVQSTMDLAPARPSAKRSKVPGTLASWRTDRNLRIVGVTRWPGATLRALPAVGQVVVKTRRRTGILESAAHLQALRGQPGRYRFTLFGRQYEVRVFPRRDRRRRIVGVRGSLHLARKADAPAAPADADSSELRELMQITRRRHQNSFRSAIRSLELAKAVADTARLNAEIRNERAADLQQRAIEAQIAAEAEGRRARFLADASAILDSSVDRRDTLNRVGRLLVLRLADWCVLYLNESGPMAPYMLHHRDPQRLPLLARAFPTEVVPVVPTWPFDPNVSSQELAQRGQLFASVSPEDYPYILAEANPTKANATKANATKANATKAFREMGVQSLIRTVISSHGRVVGMLLLGSDDPGRLFAIQDLQMARDLSSRIGLARESSILYDEAQREIALRREIEARLRVFNQELEQRVRDRTSMLEDATREANSFAYTVAHDLRAPLRAITGFCQALQEDYSTSIDEVGRDYLSRIVSGAKRMDDLIRDLLDYARLNRAEIRKGIVELDEVVDQLLVPLGSELESRGARVSVARPLGRAIGQGGVLSQALTNLISNAVKFVAPGVVPEIRIRTEPRPGRLRIVIEDNGIGIAPEHHERIFGIFERLNRAEQYPGTGIGLAIVRRAVERLGGTVGLDSRLGQGSQFWIELPAPLM